MGHCFLPFSAQWVRQLLPQAWSYTWMTLWCKLCLSVRLTAGGLSALHINVDAVLRLLEASWRTQLSSCLGMTVGHLHLLPRRARFTLVLVPGVSVCHLKWRITSALCLPTLAYWVPHLLRSTHPTPPNTRDVLSWLQHGEEYPITLLHGHLLRLRKKYLLRRH